jgi:hypothetical protein
MSNNKSNRLGFVTAAFLAFAFGASPAFATEILEIELGPVDQVTGSPQYMLIYGIDFGDIVPGMMLGWHHGNWHFKTHTLVNVPIGFWERGNLANMGFNHWAIDNAAAFTWLDPKIGLELSAMAGFTYNWKNSATDYKTGTEFHVEYAAVQNFSKRFALGINGYFYDQVTGDSGSGARLGSFEGRVVAIGPVMNLNFQVGKIPVATSLKYFREFDVENRLEGDAGYITLTMPLSVAGH